MKNVLILAMGLLIVSLIVVIVYQDDEIKLQKAEDAKVALISSLVTPKTRPLEQVIVDGDEMPGLTDRAKPDTCIAYLDENNIVHLQYAK